MSSKIYYMADSDYMDEVFGSEYPVCMSAEEVDHLANEWDNAELWDHMHEANADEIEMYGISEF